MSTILIVDDQPAICYSLKRLFESEGLEPLTAKGGHEALKVLKDTIVDIALIDVRMPDMDGLELLSIIKQQNINVQVLMMTAFSSTEKAIEAIRLGAYDYLTKPVDNDELLKIVRDILRVREFTSTLVGFGGEDADFDGDRIIGNSPQMLEIYKTIGRVAPTDATVLIRGESGTGKELIARAIYHYSKRAKMPFLAVNCAAIVDALLESELFGHERGAFTGAEYRKIGKFERCHKGTLFLDEIGDMSLKTQAKVLRALQDGTFERVGGNETIKTDVRIIAATNRDIEGLVKTGRFREDLYYRLNVVTINIPPLRERISDVDQLVSYFIKKYSRVFSKPIDGISHEALECLKSRHWYGNVRELENTIQKAIILCRDNHISTHCFEFTTDDTTQQSCLEEHIDVLVKKVFQYSKPTPLPDLLCLIETAMIKKALEQTGGNQVQAAKMLGISRNTLRSKANLFD